MRHALIALALLLAAPASAQNSPTTPATPHQRALAAGYVALTTCSALFNARSRGAVRTVESIRANELKGIYPELEPLTASMIPRVAAERPSPARALDWSVSVGWDAAMPPRLAQWQPSGGCTLLPVGQLARSFPATNFSGLPQMRTPRGWPQDDADARSFIHGTLDDARIAAREGRYGEGTNTTAIVVVRDGTIVTEDYAPGFGVSTAQRTWSVAKSIAATIVGAAAQRGEANINAPAAIANWQRDGDPRRTITLDNLLRMSSGLTSDSAGNRTDGIYFGGTTVDEQAPGWPLIAQPGTSFRYANNDTLLATLAIAPSFERHPPRAFFDSVNMHATVAETDWRGNYILSSQVWATARDLARFGILYLNDGVWNGRRILPENWRTYVSTPSGPQPPGDFGYGAGFWLMNRSEGVPADTFAAFGNRGQYVVIVPSRNIVIVRRGEDPHGARFDIAAFTRDVLAALD